MTNQLDNAHSLYLRQHANQPVHWYPWSETALAKAKAQNKPILLSIGYAACHWCHVMAHESFADEETAKLMNELFINIKVDREERPDLDKVYQSAHYLLTQQAGGWPLTVFLTPDKLVPFFSGTYFPKIESHQLPAFKNVLRGIANFYNERHEDIQQQNNELLKLLQHELKTLPQLNLNDEPLKLAIPLMAARYDQTNGGFGDAPKFPQAPRLAFLSAMHSYMADNTLTHMAEGGIYDHVAGGFFRYSVDAKWQIPHFEKMLHDNGQLLFLYTQSSDSKHQKIAAQTAEWLITEMQAPEGGFYASMDADSENEEGKYYRWTDKELKSILNETEYTIVSQYFATEKHLYPQHALAQIAQQLNLSLEQSNMHLHEALQKMHMIRAQRIAPITDKKILCAWNALAIKGMVSAAYILDDSHYLTAAQQALTYLFKYCWKADRLLSSPEASTAFLDDYAFLIDALLTSLQFNWKLRHLEWAIELTEQMINLFYDHAQGGFFFTSHDHETLIYRPKIMMDEAIPAGNGIAVNCLITLGYLLGEQRYLDLAQQTLKANWHALLHYSAEHPSLLLALKTLLQPQPIIIIRGSEMESKKWHHKIKNNDNYVLAISETETELPTALQLKKPQNETCAYVCTGTHCSAPIYSLDEV